jgi:hypothetical protein
MIDHLACDTLLQRVNALSWDLLWAVAGATSVPADDVTSEMIEDARRDLLPPGQPNIPNLTHERIVRSMFA